MKIIYLFPVLLLAACGVLRPVKDNTVSHLLNSTVAERSITGSSPTIAITRPSLPGYLDRQQLVSRSSDGRVIMNSNHLWAEPLDAGISRVTAMNLARLVNSLNIQPVETFVTMDYDRLLEIRISRFEPDASGNLIFECSWKLQPVSGRVTNTRPFRAQIAIGGDASPASAQDARITAMNEALERLAREIARVL